MACWTFQCNRELIYILEAINWFKSFFYYLFVKYHKLVRDKIPEIIAGKGKKAMVRTADDLEYALLLKEKLKEEVAEYLESENVEELADILEVIHALAKHQNIIPPQLEHLRQQKARERGQFSKRLVLLEVTE